MTTDVAAVIDNTAQFMEIYDKLDAESEVEMTAAEIVEFKRNILVKIAQATTWQELNDNAEAGGESGLNLAGQTFVIQDAIFRKSQEEFQVNSLLHSFAVLRVVNSDGEEITFTLGSDTCVAQLVTARDTPTLGFPVVATLLSAPAKIGVRLYWKFIGPPKAAPSVKSAKK
jgi:hypothetical protein